MFLRFQCAHRSAALFDRARGQGRLADLDAARKAIATDSTAVRERGAGGCCAEQAAAATGCFLSFSACSLSRPPFLPPSLPPSLPLQEDEDGTSASQRSRRHRG